jgi:hypothetical protein
MRATAWFNTVSLAALVVIQSCAPRADVCETCVPNDAELEPPQLIGCDDPDPPSGIAVALEFVLGADGRPERGTIRSHTVHRQFKDPRVENRAIDRLLTCRWHPARVDGMPVRIRTYHSVLVGNGSQSLTVQDPV